MRSINNLYCFFKHKYDVLVAKKYTTVAGTLVFFLIMSIVPLFFWLTLLVGKLPIDVERVFELPAFSAVKDVFLYLQTEAANATASTSVVLLCTTLYSATNLFFQMRHGGELIYGYRRKRKGWRMRISAFIWLFIVLSLVIAALCLLALGTFLFAKHLTEPFIKIFDYLLLLVLGFVLVLLLNIYVCPYKENLKSFLTGTLFTVVAWSVAVVGFAIYLRIGNVRKLYGALSVMIVFLLWLYVMTICFIAGVIFNSERILRLHKSQRKQTK